MVFWILTGVTTLIVAAALALAVLRGKRETGPAEAYDLKVYKDQLKEVEAEAERGKIDGEEAKRLKLEISRRLLAADAKIQSDAAADSQPRIASFAVAGVIGATVLIGAFGLYMMLGTPGREDLPLQARIDMAAQLLTERPGQAEMEARIPAQPPVDVPEEYMANVEELRRIMTERPDDARGLALLARTEAALGNHKAAYAAVGQLIALKGDSATAQDYSDYADMMIIAAGGYVSPEAQEAIETALDLDPSNGVARYYGGLLMAQTGRPDLGFNMWNRLLRESPPDAVWLEPLRAQIEELAWLAGNTRFELPPAPTAPARGPTQEDMDAAAEMTAEERMEMVQGMVDGLAARLAEEGGPAQDWANLITALSVLGQREQAGAILTEAQTVFAEDATALATLEAAAARAGLTE